MKEGLSSTAQRVRDVLIAAGISTEVMELEKSTRSARDAATAIGCDIAQIVKSLVFKTRDSAEPMLLLVSGANNVSPQALLRAGPGPLEKADANYVKDRTGFAVGGVPPVGHKAPILTFMDEDLFAHEELWAAAGTPNSVFRIGPLDLQRITNATRISVR